MNTFLHILKRTLVIFISLFAGAMVNGAIINISSKVITPPKGFEKVDVAVVVKKPKAAETFPEKLPLPAEKLDTTPRLLKDPLAADKFPAKFAPAKNTNVPAVGFEK